MEGTKPAIGAAMGASGGAATVDRTTARTRRFDDALTDTLRRWTRPTTIEELRRRGVRRVRSVSLSRVAALLEKAVNRALVQRTVDGDVEGARSLSSTARAHFLELAGSESAATASEDEARLRGRATTTLDRLRRELAERRRELEREERDPDPEQTRDRRVASRLAELFAEHAGVDDRTLEREVTGLVQHELQDAREYVRRVELEVRRREVSVLERRVAKLSALLDQTESALRRAQRSATVDAGVASIYSNVQGLDDRDARHAAKSTLMRAIFEANLALRE